MSRKTKPLNSVQAEALARLVDQYNREVDRVGSKEALGPSMVSRDLLSAVFAVKSLGITYRDLKAHTGSPQGMSFWERIYRLSSKPTNVYSLPKRDVQEIQEIEINGVKVTGKFSDLKKWVS